MLMQQWCKRSALTARCHVAAAKVCDGCDAGPLGDGIGVAKLEAVMPALASVFDAAFAKQRPSSMSSLPISARGACLFAHSVRISRLRSSGSAKQSAATSAGLSQDKSTIAQSMPSRLVPDIRPIKRRFAAGTLPSWASAFALWLTIVRGSKARAFDPALLVY